MAIFGRSFPSQPPHLPKPVIGQPAPATPHFTSLFVLAGTRYAKPKFQRPRFAPPIMNQGGTGVSTPNYIGTAVLESPRLTVRPKVIRPRYPAGIVGAPVPAVTLPNYPGYFHFVRSVPTYKTKRLHLSRFRFAPTAGFIGAKLGFLTVTPTRGAKRFTVQPTRTGNLTVQ